MPKRKRQPKDKQLAYLRSYALWMESSVLPGLEARIPVRHPQRPGILLGLRDVIEFCKRLS